MLRYAFISALVSLTLPLAPAHAAAAPREVSLPLSEAIAALPVEDENRTGYQRSSFKHWTDADSDGCDTRKEVLKAEAVVAPTVGDRCTLTGGQWHSWYDGVDVDGASGLDIDHMVPLAEAWDSGAGQWDNAKRERYANDLGDDRALLAVTAKTNRSKGDKDPTSWLPPAESAHCRYVADWVAVKTRWQLSVDQPEATTLADTASGCDDAIISVELAE